MPTLAPDLLEQSLELMREYNEAIARGEEPNFPHEADRILKQHAEELTRRIEALGRKE